jgi:outer membrane protein TolC
MEKARSPAAREQLRWLAMTAIERSPAVREAGANRRAAQYDRLEAEGAHYPQIDLDADSRWSHGLSDVGREDFSGRPSYSVTASYLLFDAGRTDKLIASRAGAEDAALSRVQAAKLAVAGEAVLTALELSRLRAQIAAADGYLERIQQLVEMLARITAEDPGRLGELTQARSRVLQAKVSRESLMARAAQTELLLQKLIGNEHAAIDQLELVFLDTPALETLIESIAQHPLVRQADFEALAGQHYAHSLAAARKPKVNLIATHTPITPGLSGDTALYAGVRLNYTLFKGFSDRAAEHAALERATGAQNKREQLVMERVTTVRALYSLAHAQLARAKEYLSLLKESDQVRRDFFVQWREMGRRSLFELLAAESEHHNLVMVQLDTWFDALSGMARVRVESGALLGLIGVAGDEVVAAKPWQMAD